jgi:two-component system, OmpR family, phosphate regulon sensor histidine kinase PhoR
MFETGGQFGAAEVNQRSHGAGAPSPDWRMTATVTPCKAPNFEGVLLAMAGHDLRQPLQIIQSAHELLGCGLRTSSELRSLRSGQIAIDRLKEQLEQILTAVRVRECSGRLVLTPLSVRHVLGQACRENEHAALSKGICIKMVSSETLILSESLLLSAALRNLLSNAVKYTEPGGRILVGCRHSNSGIRIDVYDTGIGIPGEQLQKIFEAFTRLDITECDGLGIGLFIVREALGILGHRIDVASGRGGSRFSIFVKRATKTENYDPTTSKGAERMQPEAASLERF